MIIVKEKKRNLHEYEWKSTNVKPSTFVEFLDLLTLKKFQPVELQINNRRKVPNFRLTLRNNFKTGILGTTIKIIGKHPDEIEILLTPADVIEVEKVIINNDENLLLAFNFTLKCNLMFYLKNTGF